MGTRCLGYGWATLSRGYKCSGMALQVGSWVTDGQPVIVKKKEPLGNPNCGLGSQTEWNRTRHWKIIEMRIATRNVCALYRAGVMN